LAIGAHVAPQPPFKQIRITGALNLSYWPTRSGLLPRHHAKWVVDQGR